MFKLPCLKPFKIISGFITLFLSGAMLSLTLSTLYYTYAWSGRAAAYDRQVARLTAEIDEERITNREQLRSIIDRLEHVADLTGTNAGDIHEILKIAKSAATTAKSAATTAKGAATNAAKGQIRITETKSRRRVEEINP